MPSISDSSISSKRDDVDNVKIIQATRDSCEEIELSDDDTEMEHYENVAPKAKPTKVSKPKGRSGVRKSSRKAAKTDYYECSD